jgi:lipid II:glycine glycyltransferase (peptidoglycan interpeptide bridge formation enzyme)
MKKNTRYSIRFAGNQNLEIKEEINVDLLWDMLSCSAKRDGFSLHHKKHYESVLKYPDIYQLTALKKGKAIATAVFIGFGECVTYLYAGMDYNEHKMLAPYLLRWLAIKKSKLIGYKKMDFFGIAPAEIKDGKYIFDKNHQYAGITQFKLGFGGEIKTFPGTFDFVFHKNKYRIYNFIRAIRRLF